MVFAIHVDKHGVDIVGDLKKIRGLNLLSINHFVFESRYMKIVLKEGLITSMLTLIDRMDVGQNFSQSSANCSQDDKLSWQID
jgi:hypothetical protein